ncbi:hypothetical protein PAXRUDRAFT_17945 [Paxillus rubicundulus Ve08.2h10]|uniref:Uncharacterized protein n=1 Tax=Paxillus rubicundulus Ve08.2h10 TaxID=930991 RepID=A0A0D0C0E9_9AGAM|nr:hypothetical protein PAXRUDRAFT_17945 [Paxillus rubicundulus Ve08.2h10]
MASARKQTARGKKPPPVPSQTLELSQDSLLPTSSKTSTSSVRVQWEKGYSARTDRLVEWCKANESTRFKLFSDSYQDAKDEGRQREQASQSKATLLLPLVSAIFLCDQNQEYREIAKNEPAAFVPAVQRRLLSLRKKYTEMNKRLGQTGAGRTYDELASGDGTKNIIDSIVKEFPWWPDLHGWWRTNPVYNVGISNGALGQKLPDSALTLFMPSKGPRPTPDPASQSTVAVHPPAPPTPVAMPLHAPVPARAPMPCTPDIEDGEIIEDGDNDGGISDDLPGGEDIDDNPHHLLDRLATDESMYEDEPDSRFSLRDFRPLAQHTPPPSQRSLPPSGAVIDLGESGYADYPRPPRLVPRSPPPAAAASTRPLLKPISSSVPNTDESEESDSISSKLFSRLRVGSHSESEITSISTPATSSTSSRKRTRETITNKFTNDFTSTSQLFLQEMQSGREQKASTKRARLELDIWARKEKVQDRAHQRDHDVKILQETNSHEIRALEMKIKLAEIERENKRLDLQRVALSKGISGGED